MITKVFSTSPVTAYIKLCDMIDCGGMTRGQGYGEFISTELAMEFIETNNFGRSGFIDYVSIAGTGEYIFFSKEDG